MNDIDFLDAVTETFCSVYGQGRWSKDQRLRDDFGNDYEKYVRVFNSDRNIIIEHCQVSVTDSNAMKDAKIACLSRIESVPKPSLKPKR